MQILARSLILAAQFIELSVDTVVDRNDIVRAMESIGDELSNGTDEEREALRSTLEELIETTERSEPSPEQRSRLRFYRDFMEKLGFRRPIEDGECLRSHLNI